MWAAPTSSGRVCGARGPASAPLPRSGSSQALPAGALPSLESVPCPHPLTPPRAQGSKSDCSVQWPRTQKSDLMGLGEGWVSCVSTIGLYSAGAPFRTAARGEERRGPPASRRPRNAASPFIRPHFRAHVRSGRRGARVHERRRPRPRASHARLSRTPREKILQGGRRAALTPSVASLARPRPGPRVLRAVRSRLTPEHPAELWLLPRASQPGLSPGVMLGAVIPGGRTRGVLVEGKLKQHPILG